MHAILDTLSVQQDYGWFLAGFAWVLGGLGWWRMARTDPQLRWLPWSAAAGALVAAIELSQLVTPVTVQPFRSPRLWWDLALGAGAALQTAGWLLSTLGPGARWPTRVGHVSVCVALAVVRYWQPVAGGVALTVLASVALWAVVQSIRPERWTGAALALAFSTVWLSTWGPVAEGWVGPHRQTELHALGPWAALLHIGAAGIILARLVDRGSAALRAREPNMAELEPRRLFRWLGLWLIGGLVLAGLMGWLARGAFERSALARVRMAARLLDPALLDRALAPAFRLENVQTFSRPSGREGRKAVSGHLGRGILQPVAAELAEIEEANPDLRWAQVMVLREGWLVTCCFSARPDLVARGRRRLDQVTLMRPATEDDLLNWSARQPWVTEPVTMPYDQVVQAWAPLVAADRRMLGWLVFDFGVSDWAASQAQARLQAFALAGLGGVLLVLLWLRRLRERELSRAQMTADAAAAANQLKTAFLAKVSHELRTPIQSILGNAELLRPAARTPRDAARLDALRQHSELMIRLVNDLIDLSALEAGAFRLHVRAVRLDQIFLQTAESLRARAETKGLAYDCATEPGFPAWWLADGERFRQILINLAGNAIKFTDRGEVRLTLAVREDGVSPARVVLGVRDTGPGIDPAEHSRLFQPFARLESTMAKEGSGLGLALTAALCRGMGGDLTVKSDGCSGSEFVATLALRAAHAPDANGVAAPDVLRGQRILVVDDNPLIRDLFVTFFEERGAHGVGVEDGVTALETALGSDFDAVVLDLSLPRLHGVDVARRLRAARTSGRQPRIVGVSAHADVAERTRALAAGMDAFLTKPVGLAELAMAVAGPGAAPGGETPDPRASEAFCRRLAERFGDEAVPQMEAVRAAVQECDWGRTQACAHYLKNSAAVVRDDRLFDACAALETAATAGDATAIARHLAACEAAITRWRRPPDGDTPDFQRRTGD